MQVAAPSLLSILPTHVYIPIPSAVPSPLVSRPVSSGRVSGENAGSGLGLGFESRGDAVGVGRSASDATMIKNRLPRFDMVASIVFNTAAVDNPTGRGGAAGLCRRH